MKKQFISGYFGFMNYNGVNYHNGPSIYALTDHSHSLLILMPLNYAFFNEAYNVAKHLSYKDVYIIMPSVNERTISDLYNLCIALVQTKGIDHVHWMNPCICYHTDMSMMQISDFELHMNNMGASYYFDLDPNFIITPDKDIQNSYDILLWDGYNRHYFTNYFTKEKAEELAKSEHLILHVPFVSASTMDSLITGREILIQPWFPLNRMQIHSFPSPDILDDIYSKFNLHKEGVIYNALI